MVMMMIRLHATIRAMKTSNERFLLAIDMIYIFHYHLCES